ncbi:hypothetical protein EHS25_002781 [Saitozyma podzolica]|uniref:Amidohydrolase-related domain-containing protein n=1 Tax=Saitozyma podzolica TaxID=1890683 RepID=A0A427YD85_9TREE|nr:hypothetical protein EHS25_002781 [Saitozyma podzolica]
MAQVQSVPHPPFRFDSSVAPSYSKWVPPKWMLQHTSAPSTPRNMNQNGLGEPWDPKRPAFHGVDLTKPASTLKVPDVTIVTPEGEETRLTAFVDVMILDSTGKQPYRGDVLVRGQRIAKVGERLTAAELRNARVIKGDGRTLMAGLTDAHTHFTWNNSGSLDGLAELPAEEHTLFAMRSAKTFLDCGYTSCVGAASAKQRIDVVIRNAIQAGDIPGPRYLANGQEMAPESGALIKGITRFIETTEDARAAVKEYSAQGIDQIKLSMSGEEITESLRAEDVTIPDDVVAAAVEAAHEHGMRVCSHARSDESIVQCLQYGVDIIYHASFISDSTLYALEKQKDRVFVAPAAAFGYPTSKAESVGYARELEVAVAGLKEMHRRGIKVLPGGDYGFAWTPHGTYRDLELFVEYLGFTPMEAILSATALGGEIMMHPHELGKVLPGYYADLILVDGNPLEDIKLLTGHQNIDFVMINGRIHKERPKDREEWLEPGESLIREARQLKMQEAEAEAEAVPANPST